jgi:hypothetical protein
MLSPMRKAITLTLSIALLGIFAAVVVAAVGPSDGTSTLPASSTGTTETDRTTAAPDNPGIDISGPCDEAEHANDPRCTGVGADDAGRVDNSGSGSVNPGHGSDDFDDDSSGSGHGSDDFDDDSSGSDHSGGDDDSGHSGGDDDSGHGGGD